MSTDIDRKELEETTLHLLMLLTADAFMQVRPKMDVLMEAYNEHTYWLEAGLSYGSHPALRLDNPIGWGEAALAAQLCKGRVPRYEQWKRFLRYAKDVIQYNERMAMDPGAYRAEIFLRLVRAYEDQEAWK